VSCAEHSGRVLQQPPAPRGQAIRTKCRAAHPRRVDADTASTTPAAASSDGDLAPEPRQPTKRMTVTLAPTTTAPSDQRHIGGSTAHSDERPLSKIRETPCIQHAWASRPKSVSYSITRMDPIANRHDHASAWCPCSGTERPRQSQLVAHVEAPCEVGLACRAGNRLRTADWMQRIRAGIRTPCRYRCPAAHRVLCQAHGAKCFEPRCGAPFSLS
jgi:hypothetical protein